MRLKLEILHLEYCMIQLMMLLDQAQLTIISLFTQYVNKSASAIRASLKEPAMRVVASQEIFSYKRSIWTDGIQGEKVEISKKVEVVV